VISQTESSTSAPTVKLERWKGRIPGGGFEVTQLWLLMDAVAPEIAVPPDEVNERVKRMLKHIHPPSIFIVAEVDHLVRGLIIAEVGDTANTSHVGWLRMEVDPNFRNQGIGTALVQAMIKEAEKEGLKRLEITNYRQNTRARKFFRRFLFTVDGMHRRARRDPQTGEFLDTYTLSLLLGVK